MPPTFQRIGLVFGYGLSYYRNILRGIKRYAQRKSGWVFTPLAPDPESVRALRTLRFDGLIAHVFSQELATALKGLRRPIVNVSGVLPELPFPRVAVDHVQVGRMAALHLLDRGFRHFAFVGYRDHAFSAGRETGFCEQMGQAGFQVESFHERDVGQLDPTGLWSWNDDLPNWLVALPKPVAVFTSHDIQGVKVAEACRVACLRVPDEIGILGVDDDDLLCDMSRPSLSSVALPTERIGFEAAAMLDRLMRGAKPPRQPRLLPPREVVVRQSTDVLFVDDEAVAAALRHIRENPHRPIQVADILQAVPISRRSLERRFRAVLGRGLGEEIHRGRMERAKALLVGTELPMSEVARLSGFSDPRQLSVVFRQELQQTPTAYRRRIPLPEMQGAKGV